MYELYTDEIKAADNRKSRVPFVIVSISLNDIVCQEALSSTHNYLNCFARRGQERSGLEN